MDQFSRAAFAALVLVSPRCPSCRSAISSAELGRDQFTRALTLQGHSPGRCASARALAVHTAKALAATEGSDEEIRTLAESARKAFADLDDEAGMAVAQAINGPRQPSSMPDESL